MRLEQWFSVGDDCFLSLAPKRLSVSGDIFGRRGRGSGVLLASHA